LFDAEVIRVLEIHAPLRTGRRRCSGQHDTYVLSDEAVEAKRHRRHAERRYRRTGLPSDKRAFKAACNAARTSIVTSRADHIRTQLQQALGDIRATWRTAQSLLHSRQKVIYEDSECADLVGKFSLFLVDKVRHIRENIASALQQSSPGCSLHDRILEPSIQHHSEAPASPEQRAAYRSTSDSTVKTSTRCFRRCTGCLLNSASTTSWPC